MNREQILEAFLKTVEKVERTPREYKAGDANTLYNHYKNNPFTFVEWSACVRYLVKAEYKVVINGCFYNAQSLKNCFEDVYVWEREEAEEHYRVLVKFWKAFSVGFWRDVLTQQSRGANLLMTTKRLNGFDWERSLSLMLARNEVHSIWNTVLDQKAVENLDIAFTEYLAEEYLPANTHVEIDEVFGKSRKGGVEVVERVEFGDKRFFTGRGWRKRSFSFRNAVFKFRDASNYSRSAEKVDCFSYFA